MKTKIKDFRRVLRPGDVEVWKREGKGAAPLFLKVEYKEGRLSISGVEGPKSNGDAWGSCGQCVDSLAPDRLRELAPGWTREKVKKLRETWKEWHLNDMRAGCTHQRAAKWAELGEKEATLYHWRLTDEADKARKAARGEALAALEAGKTFTPTPEQARIAALSEWPETWSPEPPSADYKPAPLIEGLRSGPTEQKRLGSLYPTGSKHGFAGAPDHPDGLLCRPCPECGYKYGSAWLREEVPAEVLEFLQSLPEAATAPAWV